MHRLTCLEVILVDSIEGREVETNRIESSLVSKVKEKQERDPIFLDLKVNIHTQRVLAF